MELTGAIKLTDLQPGDICYVEGSNERYVFLSRQPHPLFPGLQMVLWWQWARGYNLDALSEGQELPMTRLYRYKNQSDVTQLLRLAILTWQQSGANLRPPV